MRHIYTKNFLKELSSFSVKMRKKFEKQLGFLIMDIRYPSLHAKKIDETKGVWQCRVDDKIRFYFTIEKDIYIFHSIKKHSD